MLNLLYEHFIRRAFAPNLQEKTGKIIRKLRNNWNEIETVLSMLKHDINFLDSLTQSSFDYTSINIPEVFSLINKPPEPCITRWETFAKAAQFILDNFSVLVELCNVMVTKKKNKKNDDKNTTWEVVAKFLKHTDFMNDLVLNSVFYKQFLEPCYKELRTHNTFDYFYYYTNKWNERLTSLKIPSQIPEIPNLKRTHNLTSFLESGIEAAIEEIGKLTEHHNNYPYPFLSGMINPNMMKNKEGVEKPCMQICAKTVMLS